MAMGNIFQGLITALITPFKNGDIDFASLKKLLDYQMQNNVDGIIIGGSTGEGMSLSGGEYKVLLEEAVNISDQKVPIIGACGASSTHSAIEIAKATDSAGADGLMVTLPPYVKPMSQGIYQHFKSVHDACKLPIMIYAIKSRTGINIDDDCLLELSKLPRIVALKDSCQDLQRPLRISAIVKKDFNILAGDDELSLAFNAQGARGCVSVASNIAPLHCKAIQNNWLRSENLAALKIHQQLVPLYNALFAETNPIGVKYAAHFLGFCENELRLPLTPATAATQAQIRKAIESLNE
jgi:4-hydroxy-tetrahydrodipicolinate synthase